jgi:hypothetical protein
VQDAPTNFYAIYLPLTTPADGLILLTNGAGTIRHESWPAVLVNGKHYTVTAAPAANHIFAGWVGGAQVPYTLVSSSATYEFPMQDGLVLEANFITNFFLEAQGAYNGLFAPAGQTRQQTNSGAFSFNLTTDGGVNGKLLLGGQSFLLHSNFNFNGAAQIKIDRIGQKPLTVALQLDLADKSVNGTVSDGSFVAVLSGDQAVFSASQPARAFESNYTLVIFGTEDPEAGPFGDSYGTVTVSDSGAINFVGWLGDGTSVSQSSMVSKDGRWPFFLQLYGGNGSIWSWNQFSAGGITSSSGLSWINATNPLPTAMYSEGFTNDNASIQGSALNSALHPLPGFAEGNLFLDFPGNLQHFVNFDARGISAYTNVTTQYAAQGVTFSGLSDSGKTVEIEAVNDSVFNDVDAYSSPNVLSDYYGHSTANRAKVIVINFTSPANNINFEYNPAGPEGYLTAFKAYNPAGKLVDQFSDTNATGDGIWYLESFPDTNVGKIEIVAPAPGWGHYIDNLQFSLGSPGFGYGANVTIEPNNVVVVPTNAAQSRKLALTITAKSGLVGGSILNPVESGNTVKFNGVVLQDQGIYGYFAGTTRSGLFNITPPGPAKLSRNAAGHSTPSLTNPGGSTAAKAGMSHSPDVTGPTNP